MFKLEEIKSTLHIALPLVAAFLAQKSIQLTDTIMMGWLGPFSLAAAALGTTLFMTVMIFCIGTISSVGVFIANARGGKQEDEIKNNLQQGFYLVLILSLPCMLIIWLYPHLLAHTQQDIRIINNTRLLLHSLVWGFPGALLFFLFREIITAFKLTHAIMITIVIAVPLTFGANYILMYGKLGFPALGIAGIGYASASIMWFMFFCLLIYSHTQPLLKKYIFPLHFFQLDIPKLRALFKVGLPSGTISILDAGTVLFAAIMMSSFGVYALAAHQIALQCVMVAYTIPFALSMVTAVQVGHAMGANDLNQVKRYTLIGLSLGLLTSVTMALLFICVPQTLLKVFLVSENFYVQQVKSLAIQFLIIAAFFQCLDATQAIMNGALRGLKDTLVPMFLVLICFGLIGIGSAYYLAFHTNIGPVGIWYGLTIGLCSAGVILVLRFLQKIHRLSMN